MISGNTAGVGGGIANGGTLTLNWSAVTDNHAVGSAAGFFGGGINNDGTATIQESIVGGNGRWRRGGISTGRTQDGAVGCAAVPPSLGGGTNSGRGFTSPQTVTIEESAISGNTATSFGGGGINNEGAGALTLRLSTITGNSATGVVALGGGIRNGASATAAIAQSTVTKNSAANGGGIFNTAPGTVSLTDSKVKHNTPNDCVGC